MAGRPRKPTSLKILDGSFRADRDGPADGQVNAGGVPEPPADLSEASRAYWGAIVPGLVASGVAKACDSEALGLMCWWLVQLHEVRRDIDAIRAANEQPPPRLVATAALAHKAVGRLWAAFGLTASDRARLRVEPPKKTQGVQPRKR